MNIVPDTLDLSTLNWTLSGWVPNNWLCIRSMELGEEQCPETGPLSVSPPVSVQKALKDAGILPDWHYGLNARSCEWVENRHWIYRTELPESLNSQSCELVAASLDYSGWIVLDGDVIAEFKGADREHVFPLHPKNQSNPHVLEIIFDCPPRFLGQFGYSSQMSVGKARFNYTWDWSPRMVQVGICGKLLLRPTSQPRTEIEEFSCDINSLLIRGRLVNSNEVKVCLRDGHRIIREGLVTADQFAKGILWGNLPVDLWQPNGVGTAKLYDIEIGELSYRVGFRKIEWRQCMAAPPEADPWICVVNDEPLFLQGINWTPIRTNYADVAPEEYRKRLVSYRNIGVNIIRVWGGAILEKECFYEICDELGLMVWQDLPLCSSGLENLPPSDPESMAGVMISTNHYLNRLITHPSLVLWCGGNELQRDFDGNDYGCGVPCTTDEPMLNMLAELLAERDPSRRFVATSASGPRFYADEKEFGLGLHWDVHGPWKIDNFNDKSWKEYWNNDDALFRSEVGCPGTSSARLIREFAGDMNVLPIDSSNPVWRYPLPWWNESSAFIAEKGRLPESLEEYVEWSQRRQAAVLAYAAASCKRRFPSCGGFIVWMGHDAFPMTANTSILDFHGEYKPAALSLREVFTNQTNVKTADITKVQHSSKRLIETVEVN